MTERGVAATRQLVERRRAMHWQILRQEGARLTQAAVAGAWSAWTWQKD